MGDSFSQGMGEDGPQLLSSEKKGRNLVTHSLKRSENFGLRPIVESIIHSPLWCLSVGRIVC